MDRSTDSTIKDSFHDRVIPLHSAPVVLIAEDDRNSRIILRQILEKEGYQVIETSNGEECIAAYQEFHPALVLLDGMMPIMNGFECCTQLKALPSSEHVPIVLVTGLGDRALVDWAFSVGATDFITKPIHWSVLRQRVKLLIERFKLYRELQEANQKLQHLAAVDGLTQLFNRRAFDDFLVREWWRMFREQRPISLLLCDIDYFKLYNDTYGHIAGDKCIQLVAEALSHTSRRSSDISARYGGDEFVAVLSNTDAAGAVTFAQNLKQRVESLVLSHKSSPINQYVTLSIGISTVIPVPTLSVKDLILSADRALYETKENGRNSHAYQSLYVQNKQST
jgi:diguanylate cyclase (GGDEF)-like protein